MSEIEVKTGSLRTSPTQVRTRGARPPRLAPVPSADEVAAYAATQVVTVLPAEVDLNIYQGDDFYLDVAVTDAASNPINVTNMAPMSQIRATPDGPAILASFNITVDATTTNLIHLHLASVDSNGLPPTCAWDLQLSQPDVTTIAAGSVTVTLQVTI
jgi:hypothetical protein